MKKLLLLAFLCYLSPKLIAQTVPQTLTVKGIVTDSLTKAPVSYVTIALEDATTKQPVRSNLTKDDGSFEIKAPADKKYQLEIEFVGYKNKILPLNNPAPVVDLGKILLQPSNKQLNEVSITAAKPLMKQEVDRLSYDVSADPESKSLTALDMMRKVPLLTVDASDNIQLKGSGNYKILVNGKESGLLAKNPSDVLRSMPATNIEKIEVITTPPAKYDAEGLAGIINIITTKNVDEGYNIGVNGRYNSIWGPGFNLNSTVKEGKFGFSGYAGFGKQNKAENPYSNDETYTANQSMLSQNGTTAYTGNYTYADGEFSYEFDSLNLVTAEVDINKNNNNSDNYGLTQTTINNLVSQQYYQNTANNSNNTGFDASINYQLGFKRSKDQLLTLSYKYIYTPATQNNTDIFTDTIKYPQPNFRQYNNSGNKEHTIQVDYAQPFGKIISIEAGGKAIIRNNFSDFQSDTLDNHTNQYNVNQSQANDFNYKQGVYSLYNSYQLKLTNWTAKGGLRYEETTTNADFSSVGVPLNTSYGNLIPSISIQRLLTTTSSINFGFTQRIQRPDISELNPFIDRSNPQFINQGNPNLKPELNNDFELNYSHYTKGSINLGLSYSFSNNSVQNVTSLQKQIVDGKIDTVTYSTFQNLGTNKNLGLNINTNYPISTKVSFSINGMLSHVWLQGYYNGTLYKNSGNTGNMFANVGYKFAPTYRLGVNAGYFSGGVNLQGQSSYFIFNQYVVSKDFFGKNGSISFVANNPWARYWAGTSTTRTPDFYQVTNYNQTYRTFAVRVSYRFGRLNSDIKKNQHGINNDDTKGGSKSNGNQ